MKPLILFLIVTLMNFHNFLSQHPDLTLHEYIKPKQSRLKNCSPKNSSVKTPWVEIQKEHTLLSFQKYIFLLLKWNKQADTNSHTQIDNWVPMEWTLWRWDNCSKSSHVWMLLPSLVTNGKVYYASLGMNCNFCWFIGNVFCFSDNWLSILIMPGFTVRKRNIKMFALADQITPKPESNEWHTSSQAERPFNLIDKMWRTAPGWLVRPRGAINTSHVSCQG